MNIRLLVVAASAAAILAGSSMGALAGGFGYAESSSSVVSVGTVICDVPFAITLQEQEQSSMAAGNGGASTTGGSWGTAKASNGSAHQTSAGIGPLGVTSISEHGPSASASGATYGSSCAGSNCGNNPY